MDADVKTAPSKQQKQKKNKVQGSSFRDWSAAKWQHLLLEHYFTSKSKSSNHPVTYLSITETSLAQIAGESSDQEGIVFKAYRQHLPKTLRELEDIFDSYDRRESSISVVSFPNLSAIRSNPQHLMLLMFSCLVACSDPDPSSRNSQYPQRMQFLLNFSDTPQKLAGLASMWRAFRTYLDLRQNETPLGRKLELPNPGNETRIGYAKRLAFPEIRDRQRLRERLKGVDESLVTPEWLVRQFSNMLVANFSNSFKQAYEEFYSCFRSGGYGRRLEQTKFYEAVRAIALEETFDRDTAEFVQVRIDLNFDMNGKPHVGVMPDGNSGELPLNERGEINLRWFFNQAQNDSRRLAPEIISALKSGVLLFGQLSVAQWRWTQIIPINSELKVMVNENYYPLSPAYKRIGRHMFDRWVLLELDQIQAATFVSDMVKKNGEPEGSIRLVGAARVGLGYLLNKISTIQVESPEAQKIAYRPEGRDWRALKVDDNGVWHPFTADEGKVLVRAKAKNDVFRHRKFQAHSFALPHPFLSAPEKSKHYEPRMVSKAVKSILLDLPIEATMSSELRELLEVLYADGRYGLSEVEAITWIRRAYPRSIVSPWQILQGLIDSGWLQEAYLLGWHSRSFFLRPLNCSKQFIGDGEYRIHFEGALPKVLLERVKTIVKDNGARLRLGNSLSPYAPAPLFAVVTKDKAKNIARELKCTLINMALELVEAPPLESRNSMGILQSWCWQEARFVDPEKVKVQIMQGVRLDKLRFKAQSGMDRYQIQTASSLRQYLLPLKAIREAYLVAHQSLFKLDGNVLINLGNYSVFPSELARYWRLQTLTSAGLMEGEDGVFRYSYPCPDEILISQHQHLLQLIRQDKPFLPFWMRAFALQSIAEGGQAQLCERNGLITPEINFML